MIRSAVLHILTVAVATAAFASSPGSGGDEREALADRARDSLRTLGDLGPTSDEVDRASERFRAAAERWPGEHEWVMGQGFVAFHRNDIDRCYDLLREAAEMAPSSAEAQYRYGNACFVKLTTAGIFSKGSLASRGRKAYERALEADPDHADARFALARFYAEAPGLFGGSRSKARDLADRLAADASGRSKAHRIRAIIASKQGEWRAFDEEMEAAYRQAADARDAAAILVERAKLLLDRKDAPNEAIAIADRVGVSTAYHFGRAQRIAALALMDRDELAAAEDRLRRATEVFPDDPDIWLLLGEVRAGLGRTAGAIAAYETIIRRFPMDTRAEEARGRTDRLR